MKKRILLVAVVLAAAIGGTFLWFSPLFKNETDTGVVAVSGTIDATEVAISFRVPGTLRERAVDEGSRVRAGDVLARLDARDAAARLRQAEASVQAARARLADLQQGARPQEIAEAKAQVGQAHANLANLEEDARRSELLYQGGAVTRQRRDRDQTASAVAAEQHLAAIERLKLVQAGSRRETINAARAQTVEAQAGAEAARVAFEDLEVKTPIDGVVTRKHAEAGETVAAGRPVVTVTDISKPWVRVYVPEHQIGKVRVGAPAKIRIDTFPGRDFIGRVSYVAAQAEFTPKNVQTQEERVKLVFAVNVTAENPEGILKPGMPADVFIDSADAATAKAEPRK
jgi:HlyD family secretion protein